ncbi:ribokinase [Marinomonas sp. A3A]|jgi:ribokinase|uniref:ribokinase n=1 Tax=Marinomonas sp. A3A TaxID=2065312 RepID=UPI001BB3AE19|nr:ribokinase [Marinomonas sp. A3A]QUX92997.1 ribokinase [Marinomonas sp. A3A]
MNTILVVGSLHYDIMINAPHQPETGETVIGTNCDYKFGGKGGNQAVSVAESNVHTRFAGAIGDDTNGQFLLSVLKQHSVDTQFIDVIPSTPSGMSVAITDADNDYSAVVIPNANTQINIETFYKAEIWENIRLLVLQNELPEHINLIAAQEAKKRGIKVCLNAAPAKILSEDFKTHIDVLVVNAIEARDMSGVTVNNLRSAAKAAALLNKIYPTVIVTAGEYGVAYSEQSGTYGELAAEKIQLISTHGAGDCFMGVLCSALANDVELTEAISRANKAAAIHVSTP